jgi:hypothetical protein
MNFAPTSWRLASSHRITLKVLSRSARGRIIGKTYPKQEPPRVSQFSKIRSDRKRLCLRSTITSDMQNPKQGIRTEASNPTGPIMYMGSYT